ncbi:MAG: type IV secretory system conjugative DNA transfer family protein [Devosia sp.]
MPELPRGFTSSDQATPIATARWALPHEIATYKYETGDLWLGVLPVPHADAEDTLQNLDELRERLETDSRLDPAWRSDTLTELNAHATTLAATDELAIGLADDRHLVTIGGTRAGKGTTAIIPNLCVYPGSLICIDPKGENAKATASRRGFGSKYCDGLGQSVPVLDPYDTTGLPEEYKASWNPFDHLMIDDPLVVDRAATIADSLITRADPDAAHWDESARIFVKALILYVVVRHAGLPDQNLITVYDYLIRGAPDQLAADKAAYEEEVARGEKAPSEGEEEPDPFTYLLHLMLEVEEFGGIIAGGARTLLDMGDRERGGVLSTARRNLEFLERPAMRAVLTTSSFDLHALKTDPQGLSIYLCLPPQRMVDTGRWLRMIVNSCLDLMYEIKIDRADDSKTATGYPVLFLLEEFASLKHMEIIEHAAGFAAGFGVKLWVIVQDINQLKRYYREGWETFLGNAGVVQAFANSDTSTLEFLSKKCGDVEVAQMVRNINTQITASTSDPSTYQRFAGILNARTPGALLTAPVGLMMDAQSTGQSASSSTAYNQQILKNPLLLPDEIERAFKREDMSQLVLIKGRDPLVLTRTNYFDHPHFAGLFDPIREPYLTKAEALKRRDQQLAEKATARKEAVRAAQAFLKDTERALSRSKPPR